MALVETKYNFVEIQSMVDAARNLQESGQHIHCEEILKTLAKEIMQS